VSNHVRVLRESGLVTDERDGTRRNLIVRPDAADDLLSSLRGVLAGSAHARAGRELATT
jgi:DNA-binding transcriptional ArsR family regulator